MNKLPLKTVAEIIVKVFGFPEDAVQPTLTRLRNMRAKGLLTVDSDPGTGWKTDLLDRYGAAEAVLLCELADMGFTVENLRELRAAFNDADKGSRFRAYVKMLPVAEDSQPVLEVKLYRADARRIYTFLDLSKPPKQDRVSKTLALVDEGTVATVLTVELAKLLSEFVEEFAKTGAARQ